MPKAGYSSVTIPQSIYAQAVEIAKSRKVTVSTLLTQLVNGTVPSTVQLARFDPEEVKAGRVGFEPTICGSAGRRLGPGSTTGPANLNQIISL